MVLNVRLFVQSLENVVEERPVRVCVQLHPFSQHVLGRLPYVIVPTDRQAEQVMKQVCVPFCKILRPSVDDPQLQWEFPGIAPWPRYIFKPAEVQWRFVPLWSHLPRVVAAPCPPTLHECVSFFQGTEWKEVNRKFQTINSSTANKMFLFFFRRSYSPCFPWISSQCVDSSTCRQNRPCWFHGRTTNSRTPARVSQSVLVVMQ